MGKIPSRDIHVKFALLSFVAVAAIAVAIAFFGSQAAEARVEAAAGRAAADALAPAVQAQLAGLDLSQPLPQGVSERLGALADPQGALHIRLWNDATQALYSSAGEPLGGLSPEATPPPSALGSGVVSSVSGGAQEGDSVNPPAEKMLVTYAPLASGALLEIRQDYAPIGAEAAQARQTLYGAVGLEMAGLYVALQLLVWLGGRASRREYDRLHQLYQTERELRSSLDLTDVLGRLARNATIFAGGQIGLVTLLDESNDDLVLRASYDHKRGVSAEHHRNVEEWFTRRCAATGKTVITTQPVAPYKDILDYKPPNEGPVTILCAPMALRGRAMGVISIFHFNRNGRYQPSEVSMVEDMASQAAMAVEQASLFAKVRAYASELELSYDGTMKALMAALDAKDQSTEGHSERVATLTVAVAREMGLADERLLHIERGALLHDVGKIGVPDAILQKPHALTRRERETMQKHPLMAGLMASKVDFLEAALPVLLYHHERYDGTGYPFGLAGDHIPLEARVFAVVDAYDAMTSDRPYRQAMPHQEAMTEIRAQAGAHFDPQVVEIFERIMARQIEELEQQAA